MDGFVDIWQMLADQTPLAIRWVFGVLLGGIIIMVGWLFKRQRKDIARLHQRIDNLEGTLDQTRFNTQRDMVRIALDASSWLRSHEPAEKAPGDAYRREDDSQ